MRFETLQLDDFTKYTFVIETAEKPSKELKERIRAQIGEAMEALDRISGSYSVMIREGRGEPGEIKPPEFSRGDYILFALADNGDPNATPSDSELEEERKELAEALYPPPESRIALVLLYDAFVTVIPSQSYAPILSSSYDIYSLRKPKEEPRHTPIQEEGLLRNERGQIVIGPKEEA